MRICCFYLSYVIINIIPLGLCLLDGQKKTFDGIKLGFRETMTVFFRYFIVFFLILILKIIVSCSPILNSIVFAVYSKSSHESE